MIENGEQQTDIPKDVESIYKFGLYSFIVSEDESQTLLSIKKAQHGEQVAIAQLVEIQSDIDARLEVEDAELYAEISTLIRDDILAKKIVMNAQGNVPEQNHRQAQHL
jgi:hypothetical protein